MFELVEGGVRYEGVSEDADAPRTRALNTGYFEAL